MIKTVSIFLIAISLIGCSIPASNSSTAEKSTSKPPKSDVSGAPAWLLDTVNIDQFGNLFGNGSGNNINSAKNSALADIAGFLNSKVNSKSISSQEITRAETDKQKSFFKQDVEISTQEQVFNGATIENSDKVGNYFFVRMKLDGKQLANAQITNINKAIDSLTAVNSKFSDQSLIKFDAVRTLIAPASDIRNANISMSLLDNLDLIKPDFYIPSKEKKELFNNYSKALEKYNQIIQQLKIFVENNNKKLDPFLEQIKWLIGNLGIKISSNPNIKDPQQGKISIDGSIINDTIYGAFISIVDLRISIYDSVGLAIGSKSYSLRQQSPTSFDAATNLAADSWRKKLQNDNIINNLINDSN